MLPKLTVDPNDYRCLKPLLALEFGRSRNLDGEVAVVSELVGASVDTGLGFGSSALLEVDEDVQLFSENAICSFLLPETSEARIGEIQALLEWESSVLKSQLAPVVASAWSGPKTSDYSVDRAKTVLAVLDSRLAGKRYLVGDSLSAADVSIFVCVYPLASDEMLRTKHFSNFPCIIDWFQRLNNLDSFRRLLSRTTHDKGALHFKESFLTNAAVIMETETVSDKVLLRCVSESTAVSEVAELTKEEIAAAHELWLGGRKSLPKYKKPAHPILPREGERNVLIASALPYVNNVPHLGNIIGCVLSADVYARYCRLRNYTTFFVGGTDEYGTATETKAIEEGVTPQEICDKYYALHSQIYKWFNISFDHFGRTTMPEQTEIAQELFWQVHRNGFTFEDSLEQLYCPHCDRFLADRFVEGICPHCAYGDARGDQCDGCGKLINAIDLGSPRCKLCQTEPYKKTSKHIFLDLPKLAGKVQEHFDRVSQIEGWSQSATVITKAWLREGLKPRCITRDLKWGVPVPLEGFQDKVFYVWFDAPIGYPSITANYTKDWKRWWKNPSGVQLFHFMAKDNVPFHSVMFPACLLGADDGYTLLSCISATEYLNYEDGKFSKSRGVGVFGNDARETGIPADIWRSAHFASNFRSNHEYLLIVDLSGLLSLGWDFDRFYLLFIRPETTDAVFCWSDLVTRNNSELLNNLGNFINRALVFVVNFFDGLIPAMELTEEDQTIVAQINREVQAYIALLEKARLRDAIRHILNVSRLGNQHIQNQKPWVLVKGPAQEKARAGSVIGLSVNISCLLSIMLEPYMPATAQTVRNQLGVDENMEDAFRVLPEGLVCYLEAGHRIGKPVPLFRKIEPDEVEVFRKRFAGNQSSRESTPSTGNKALNSMPIVNSLLDSVAITLSELNVAIANQGDVVRALKSKGAEKKDIALEVAKLLELKKRLSLATNEEPTPILKKDKKKSPKKAV